MLELALDSDATDIKGQIPVIGVIPRKATNNNFSLAMNTNSCVAQACNSLL